MADEKNNKGATSAGSGKRARGARKPVTIDVEARPASTKPAAARKKTAARKAAATSAPRTKTAPPPRQPATAAAPQPPSPPPPPEPPVQPAAPPAGPSVAPPAPPPSSPVPSNDRANLLLAGIAGGVVALVLILILQGLGWWPTPGRDDIAGALEQSANAERIAAENQALTTALRGDLDALKNAPDDFASLRAELAELRQAHEALVAASADALATDDLTRGLSELESRLDARIASAAPDSGAAALRADQIARVAALEAQMAEVTDSGGLDLNAPSRSLVLLLLDQMAAGSQPFVTVVDAAAGFIQAEAAFVELRPLATSGVPSRRQLQDQFATLATRLDTPAADEPAADGSLVGPSGWLGRWLGRVVTIRREGGSAPPATATEPGDATATLAAAVAAGDFTAALTARAALPADTQAATADWAAAVADRQTVDRLVAAIIAAPQSPQN